MHHLRVQIFWHFSQNQVMNEHKRVTTQILHYVTTKNPITIITNTLPLLEAESETHTSIKCSFNRLLIGCIKSINIHSITIGEMRQQKRLDKVNPRAYRNQISVY